jgi:signal transduction histidine kinase
LGDDGDKIFEAFHTTKPKGLGLGLTICQTIIRAHGGNLWSEKNKSYGATFHFQLPIVPENL